MRTTIDLPDDLYQHARDIAHHRKISVSQVVADVMRRGMTQLPDVELRRDPLTGFLVMHFGEGPITADEVRALIDEDE